MSVRLSLVVTTIGRVPEIVRLARSIDASTVADQLELVVVDQSPDQRAIRAVSELAPTVRLCCTTSARGASLGRNVGLGLATGELVGFPNDNSWFAEPMLADIIATFDGAPELGGLCVKLITADGRPATLRWAPRAAPVRAGNCLRTAALAGMFFRRDLVMEAGGFDETIGTGSPGKAQSGEETDLLLRLLAAGHRVDYDPALTVHTDEPRDRIGPHFVTKMGGYGVGQGVVWRRHRLPVWMLAWLVSRKLVAAPLRAARGHRHLALSDLAWARGCVTGYLQGGRP
jgi:GT2 family glycosyltransferase